MNLPAWNIESEYPSLQSAEFRADEERVRNLISQIEGLVSQVRSELSGTSKLAPATLPQELQHILILQNEASELSQNLGTYISCLLSVNAMDEAARSKGSQLQSMRSMLAQAFKPVQLFLASCNSDLLNEVLSADKLKGSRFHWNQMRTLSETFLSEKEEVLLSALSPSGHGAWGLLYKAISGSMKVRLELDGETQEVGLAQAAGMTRSALETERKAAWNGIQNAWREQKEPAAAILNSLAEWRLQIAQKRSHTKKVDFLSRPLFDNRIQLETLNALWKAVDDNKKDIQKAAHLMAKMLGKEKLDPWDLLAPSPIKATAAKVDFESGFELIRKAFHGASPAFGDFAEMMSENHWIEARVLPNKGNGAFCCTFAKSRTPRVFQTYLGSNQDISTLAHELGHAYHSWVLRDLPAEERDYPMTLAETASIFAETVLADEWVANSKTPEEKIEFAWSEVEGAVNLLLNIPARFEFEFNFYNRRAEGIVSPRELSELTDQAWSKWYGDTVTQNDTMFWASKLHFSMAHTSFYNFPYTFGYLFGLSVYARRKELGAAFWPKYTEILKDTGRMTAEDLIQKHLGEDIRKPEFWQKSIDVVKEKIELFEILVKNEKDSKRKMTHSTELRI